MVQGGVEGVRFAVWAPNARRVSVVGPFNHWDGRRHPMRFRRECGVWEIFLPGVFEGARYKFEVIGQDGELLPLKVDPYAHRAELRPANASIVEALPDPVPASDERRRANALDAPMSVYEVHLGSWRRVVEDGNRWLNWDELAGQLVPYARDLGFTHLEGLAEAARCLRCASEVCVGCTFCARTCPDYAITVERIDDPGHRAVTRYDLDLSKCCFCGLCAEQCPTGALRHTGQYELTFLDRALTSFDKHEMVRSPQGTRATGADCRGCGGST